MLHATGIGWTTIILGHTWLMEHNPEIDWCTRKVSMTRCPSMCGPTTTMNQLSQLRDRLAEKVEGSPRASSCHWVHIKEVPEAQSKPAETEAPPGFAHPDPDEIN